jgi:ribose transport system substrate-binding protein
MKLLENGTLEGLILQNPYGMGYATVVAAARVSLGLGNEAFVNCGYSWVTKENLESNDIKGMLY